MSLDPQYLELKTRLEVAEQEISALKATLNVRNLLLTVTLPLMLTIILAAVVPTWIQVGRFEEQSQRIGDQSKRIDSVEARLGKLESEVHTLAVAQAEMKQDLAQVKEDVRALRRALGK